VRPLTPPIPPPEMVEEMIGQLVLSHPQVKPHLHVGAEPLTLFPVPELARGAPGLEAAGRPVRVVAIESEAQFVFRSYERIGTAAQLRIHFAIPAEGVSGHVDVELRDNVWRATGADVVTT
jgi:hypothetical protein